MTDYSSPQFYPAPLPLRQRPTGVTVLAILSLLGGVLLLVAAVVILIALALVGDPMFQEALMGEIPEWFAVNLTLFLAVIGGVVLVMGVLALLVAYGFLNGKRWAWFLAILYGFLSAGSTVVSTILTGGLSDILTLGFSIIIPVLVLVYLFRPNVKAWFSV